MGILLTEETPYEQGLERWTVADSAIRDIFCQMFGAVSYTVAFGPTLDNQQNQEQRY